MWQVTCRCPADAIRYSVHPEYRPHQQVRNQSELPAGFSALPRRTVSLSLWQASDSPVLHPAKTESAL